MNSNFRRAALLFAVAFPAQNPKAQAQAIPNALCENGECQAAIAAVDYEGRAAYKLTDGRTEAIIVPEIGRVMSFGKVGGPNLLWNAAQAPKNAGWKNFGGDKTWLAPQGSWKQFHGSDNWPPDPAFDGTPHRAEVLSGGKLRLTTPLSVTGIRLTRVMYFDANGEFVIEQTARKEKGAPIRAGLWSITQTVPGEAVFLPVNPRSTYAGGFRRFEAPSEAQKLALVKPNLLRITPANEGGGLKFGVDATVSSIASLRDGVAFLQKTAQPQGNYPDAQGQGAGLPVEIFVLGDAKSFYVEMELLGPLKTFAVGGKSTQTVRWSLHTLPSKNANSPAVADAVEKLLFNG